MGRDQRAQSERAELTVGPIGWVVKVGRPVGGRYRWEETESEIEIEPAWADALDGLEAFSHVWLLWWLNKPGDKGDEPPPLRVRPQRRQDMPLLGVFATRSPRRPNPLAITAVRLLQRQGTRLRVLGLDAFEGTAILDIKPYLRRGDLVAEATTPDWLERLWQVNDEETGPCPC